MRKENEMPLASAAPALQPTARPLAIQIGARPPPNRSPLMELAKSFSGFDDVLMAGLSQAAAREDRDAEALGQIEARKQGAKQSMDEIKSVAKELVDAGKIPAVRQPAFIEGYQMRVGTDLGIILRTRLDSKLAEAAQVGNGDPNAAAARIEKLAVEAYNDVLKSVPKDTLHTQIAFDQAAGGVIEQFRQQASARFASALTAANEQKMADSASETLVQLADAPDDYAAALREDFRGHANRIHTELRSDEANPFIIRNVVKPAVLSLLAKNKVREADAILSEMEKFDVTGKGGILGKTADGKAVFAELRRAVTSATRDFSANELSRLQSQDGIISLNASHEAGQELLDLRSKNGGRLPVDQLQNVIDRYRAAHPNDPVAVKAYTATVAQEADLEEKLPQNERAVSDLELQMDTLEPTKLDAAEAQLGVLADTGSISPSKRTQLAQKLSSMRAIYGAIEPTDFARMKRGLYADRDDGGMVTINFGAAPGQESNVLHGMWEALPESSKESHILSVTKFYSSALMDELRKTTGGDPKQLPTAKGLALEKAFIAAQGFARDELRRMNTKRIEDEQTQKIKKHASDIRNAALVSVGVKPDVGVGYKVPGKQANAAGSPSPKLAAGYYHPGPATDAVEVWIPSDTFGEWLLPGAAGTSRRVVMSELAKDAATNPKSRDLYGYVKGKLGMLTKEIKDGVTRDGLPFDPSKIDPRLVSVFDDSTMLEKAWNNGEPTDLFFEVGDRIDPTHKLRAEDFYLAQRAIFSARAQLYHQ